MFTKFKINNIVYILMSLSLIFYVFFSEKNIIALFKNKKIIQDKEILFDKKKNIKKDLENKINSFSDSEIYKELILKEKLFLKNKNDKLIFYELDK